jgi:hypothetical protein
LADAPVEMIKVRVDIDFSEVTTLKGAEDRSTSVTLS